MPTTACPECREEVYVDIDAEQSDVVFCDECGADLEIVGLDPIELDVFDKADLTLDDDLEDDDLDY